jgi:hypothetical protein
MEEMSITECCIAIVGFLAAIPSMLAALVGMDAGDGLMETFVEKVVNAAADVAEEAAAIAAVMDNLLFNMRQKYAASKFNAVARKRHGKKQRAATKVQSHARGHQVRTRQRWQGAGERDLAAILIQRAFLTKRNLKREGVSLKRVLINQIRYRTALKSRVGIGSHWTNVGPEKPAAGSEIFCKRLAAALRTKQDFSNEEVAAFEVLLRMDSFIKVDEQYFEQVGSAGLGSVEGGQAAVPVSKATGWLSTETDSPPPPKQRVATSRRGRQAKRRMSGQEEYGSLSSFGFFKASSSNSKQPSGRSLLTDVHASTEPVAAKTAVVERVLQPVATAAVAVEPLAAATEPSSASPTAEAAREVAMREAAARGDLAFLAFVADQAAAAATLLGGSVVSERDISLLNFGTLDASRDSISSFEGLSQNSNHSQGQVRHRTEVSVGAAAGASMHSDQEVATSSVEMRPGLQWLIESMHRTVLMFDADEDQNDEDGISVDSPEQHPDRNIAVDERVVPSRVHRFETVRERVTRARASLPRGLPKSVPGRSTRGLRGGLRGDTSQMDA